MSELIGKLSFIAVVSIVIIKKGRQTEVVKINANKRNKGYIMLRVLIKSILM